MSHQMPYNQTPQNKGGNRLTGSRDAIYLHNKYQTEIDNAHTALVNEIHHVEGVNRRKAIDFYHQSEALREDMKAHQEEAKSLEATLENLLTKEFGQEYKMWKENTQGLNIRTTEGIRSETIGILGHASSSTPLKYLEKYPAHSAHPSISNNKRSLEIKIKDIRAKAEAYNKAISSFNYELPFYTKNTEKCQANLKRYLRIIQEGNDKINNCRYVNGFFYRMLPEDKKAEILLDTLKHPIEKWENMISMFEDDLNKYQSKPFEELTY